MSVRGEFVRLVEDAADALRDGPPDADALADALLGARDEAAQDLPGAAARVLEVWGDGGADRLDLDPGTRAQLEDAAERMLAVSRIILGR